MKIKPRSKERGGRVIQGILIIRAATETIELKRAGRSKESTARRSLRIGTSERGTVTIQEDEACSKIEETVHDEEQ